MPSSNSPNTPMMGRPRDESTAPVIKEAARKLVREQGYNKVSISQIIQTAGVSRQSLYRRWPSKADLVFEAFFESAGPAPTITPGESFQAAVLQLMRDIFDHLKKDGPAIRSLIAAAQDDPEFGQRFYNGFVKPREELMNTLLKQAIENNELPKAADIDIMTSMLHGGFWYRLLNGLPLDHDWAKGLVSQIFKGAEK